MGDGFAPGTDHLGLGTASDLLAGVGPAGPQARATRFATGFGPLDDVLRGGMRAQDLVLVGGRPGIGKTVITLQWARWMAMREMLALKAPAKPRFDVMVRMAAALGPPCAGAGGRRSSGKRSASSVS